MVRAPWIALLWLVAILIIRSAKVTTRWVMGRRLVIRDESKTGTARLDTRPCIRPQRPSWPTTLPHGGGSRGGQHRPYQPFLRKRACAPSGSLTEPSDP